MKIKHVISLGRMGAATDTESPADTDISAGGNSTNNGPSVRKLIPEVGASV